MKVKVEQRHIDNGMEFDACKCPIALALREMFPETEIYVCGKDNPTTIRIERIIYEIPDKAIEFITDFDLAGSARVEPFEFELEDCNPISFAVNYS